MRITHVGRQRVVVKWHRRQLQSILYSLTMTIRDLYVQYLVCITYPYRICSAYLRFITNFLHVDDAGTRSGPHNNKRFTPTL